MKKKGSRKSTRKKTPYKVSSIPAKIKEIISYLSFSFSSKLLEKEDLSQDLYLLYCEMMQKDKRARKAEPGYFFWRFKKYLITKYNRETKRVCKEWEYVLQNDARRTQIQSSVGYLSNSRINKKKRK